MRLARSAILARMSALPPRADMYGAHDHVCYGPQADIQKKTLRRAMSDRHGKRTLICVLRILAFEPFDMKRAIAPKSEGRKHRYPASELPMTSDQFRMALDKIGLSQVAAARLLGVNETTLHQWATGERDIPAPAIRFLHYLIATRTKGEDEIKILDSWILVRQGSSLGS